MAERHTTFILKFYRNKDVLDIEIHPDWDSAAAQAVNYVNCFCRAWDATKFDELIQEWDSELGPMTWSDGEYEIFIDSQEARHAPQDNNLCLIIPFRRQVA